MTSHLPLPARHDPSRRTTGILAPPVLRHSRHFAPTHLSTFSTFSRERHEEKVRFRHVRAPAPGPRGSRSESTLAKGVPDPSSDGFRAPSALRKRAFNRLLVGWLIRREGPSISTSTGSGTGARAWGQRHTRRAPSFCERPQGEARPTVRYDAPGSRARHRLFPPELSTVPTARPGMVVGGGGGL